MNNEIKDDLNIDLSFIKNEKIYGNFRFEF